MGREAGSDIENEECGEGTQCHVEGKAGNEIIRWCEILDRVDIDTR